MSTQIQAHRLQTPVFAPARPPARAAVRTVAAAIDAYLAAALGQLDRVIAAVALVEPRTTEAEAAARTLGTVVETLTGLALGQVIGAVAAQLRTTLPALTPVIERAIHQATRALGPSTAPALISVDDEGPARGFAAVLGQRVRRRLLLAPSELRPVLAAIAAAIETHAAGEERALVRVLALLADDPLITERFTATVRTGWTLLPRRRRGHPPPTGAPVWDAWARRAGAARGPRRAPAGTTAERRPDAAPGAAALAARGVIVQIG